MLVNIAKPSILLFYYILGFMQDCLLCVEIYIGCHLQVFYMNPDKTAFLQYNAQFQKLHALNPWEVTNLSVRA